MGLDIKAKVITLALVSVSTQVWAQEAEEKFSLELADCAAYYQIATETISSMNAPQMKAVGDRLKASGEQAVEIAKKYDSEVNVVKRIKQAKEKQIASLNGSSNLGLLMGKYKDSCKRILEEPSKRLDYWVMATM